ncbi:MAG TPA: antitoxin Xre/MbcA/ParS toxin-binding domain-containing protein [Pyrinomonadaceae bacterium]|nr:antitoxin Xre/MbcA/ParS toxin-binding domain-containing protein [Pyrinomonadaceae bacterium]
MPSTKATTEHASPDIKVFREKLRTGKRGSDHLYIILLGMKTLETDKLLKQIEKGLPFRMLERLGRNLELPIGRVAELAQIRNRTLHRRKEAGRLQPDESDRLLRVSRVFAKAIELFEGDHRAAVRWLSEPQRALGGAVPLTLAKSELGALEVERLIGRMEHGVFS